MSKKKVIGLKFVHTVELKNPIEVDWRYLENPNEDLENPNKELSDITDKIFVGVDNLVYEFGHNYKHGIVGYIYEGDEL